MHITTPTTEPRPISDITEDLRHMDSLWQAEENHKVLTALLNHE